MRRQRGFVLLTVLLVMALVAALIGALVQDQGRAMALAQVRLNQSRALAVAAGLEAWVRWGLAQDARHSSTDHLNELWARPLPPTPFAGGVLSGHLEDAQARVNLNNLMLRDAVRLRWWRAVFTRLFQRAGVAEARVDVVQDWVDADGLPRPQGAEDDTYLLKQPPYRCANGPLTHPQSLIWLRGFDQEQVDRLVPYVSTLPEPTPINVNTASVEVLTLLAPWFDRTLAQAWVLRRKAQPAAQLTDFWQFVAQRSGRPLAKVKQALPAWALSTASRYFLLRGRLSYGNVVMNMSGLFRRQGERVQLIMRWFEPEWR